MTRPASRPRQAGFSALEGLITVAVLGIVAAGTLPSFAQTRDLHAVRGAYEALRGDLQLAQFEAIKRNAPVTLSIHPAALCWGVTTSSSCDCAAGAPPTAACDLRRAGSAVLSGVTLQSASFGGGTQVVFEPVRGMASHGSVLLVSPLGRKLQLSVSPLGAVSGCTRPDSARIDRMPACS